MFEINDKARNLSKKEMLQYKKDGYISDCQFLVIILDKT